MLIAADDRPSAASHRSRGSGRCNRLVGPITRWLALLEIERRSLRLWPTPGRGAVPQSLRPRAAQRGQLMVTGKGNKQRVVPVLPFVAEALEDDAAACPYTHDPLFWET
jgi:hypothetical protein